MWLQAAYLGGDGGSAKGGGTETGRERQCVSVSLLLVTQSCGKCAPLSDREAAVSLHQLQFIG